MKREEKKQSVKEKIVQSLLKSVDDDKFEILTSQDIAENANVSKRTLYKYFPSKKEMYLGIVEYCFSELARTISLKCETTAPGDPLSLIECIGRCYLEYCLKNPKRSKIIVSYDEENYIADYPRQVGDILKYSNTFELSKFIEQYYESCQAKPAVSASAVALYLWAEVQGIATLMLSKESWIKSYYGMDFDTLINEHIQLLKILLNGVCHEKEK